MVCELDTEEELVARLSPDAVLFEGVCVAKALVDVESPEEDVAKVDGTE